MITIDVYETGAILWTRGPDFTLRAWLVTTSGAIVEHAAPEALESLS